MSNPAEWVKKFGIDQLSVEERVALIDEIWKSIEGARPHGVLPSPADIARYERQMLEAELDVSDDEDDLFVFPCRH